MPPQIDVQPLPQKTRQKTFGFLFLVFVIAIPLLYMYATGYRLDFKRPTNLVSTGGLSITAPLSDVEIYIDDEIVRAARSFRRAFYIQGLDIGTHRVYVQKDGYHTWVKELPVSQRLVTEVEAFNFPLVPQVRVISEWQSATGSMVVREPITFASTTNTLLATTSLATTTYTHNEEFVLLKAQFASGTDEVSIRSTTEQLRELLKRNASSTVVGVDATTTILSGGAKLHTSGEDLFATWVGSFEQMPYYYCAPDFPRYTTTGTSSELLAVVPIIEKEPVSREGELVIHPVQTIPEDIECDPSIRIDRKQKEVQDFEFLPGSSDFVVIVHPDGVYVAEIDDRSWQNIQPLILGKNLKLHIENGNIYVYDGKLIYQIITEIE